MASLIIVLVALFLLGRSFFYKKYFFCVNYPEEITPSHDKYTLFFFLRFVSVACVLGSFTIAIFVIVCNTSYNNTIQKAECLIHSALNYTGDGYMNYSLGFTNMSQVWQSANLNITTGTTNISNINSAFHKYYSGVMTNIIAQINVISTYLNSQYALLLAILLHL